MATKVASEWGTFQITIAPMSQATRDITYVRDVPTQVQSFSSGDPFSDMSATLVFPAITAADHFGGGSELEWVRGYANVDINHITPAGAFCCVLWEGMVAGIDVEHTQETSQLTLTCMGAMYQLNSYVAQPRYYEEEINSVDLIKQHFTLRGYRHFRMHGSLEVGSPGQSDHMTRYSGSWEDDLTFIQNLLSAMIDDDGTDDGIGWTLTKKAGRRGVLRRKDRDTVHWTVDVRSPGLELSLSKDVTSVANVIYGEGTDLAGTKWRNTTFRDDPTFGFVTEYVPLAFLNEVWPDSPDNPNLNLEEYRVERYIDFGQGFSLLTATEIARQIRRKEYNAAVRRAGYQGTITLRQDPNEGHRLEIKAGENIRLLAPNRTNWHLDAKNFHIVQVEHIIQGDEIVTTLTVDSLMRDLITVLQALERMEEGKTAARILQVNRDSSMVDDVDRPWDYDGGSGFMPYSSKPYYTDQGGGIRFPFTNFSSAKPPSGNTKLYIRVNGGSGRNGRWTFFPVMVSEHGSIRLVEMAAYNAGGSRARVPFHLSFYGGEELGASKPAVSDMPYDGGGPSPFLENAFSRKEEVNVNLQTHPSLIIGWGDFDQKAGYWPGLESEGDPATGLLRDEAEWSYQLARGVNKMWGALYCEAGSTVYFIGRLYRSVDT